MSLTTDPNDPNLSVIEPTGMQASYLVLSEEERAKGFVRPLRRSYRHAGIRPTHPTRELTPEEHLQHDRFGDLGYVLYEAYPEGSDEAKRGLSGRFWSTTMLSSGCGTVTSMGLELCETWARDPSFYGATFCCGCGKHLPVEEFVWTKDGCRVGS